MARRSNTASRKHLGPAELVELRRKLEQAWKTLRKCP